MRTKELFNYAKSCFDAGKFPHHLKTLEHCNTFKVAFNRLSHGMKVTTLSKEVADLFADYGCAVSSNGVGFTVSPEKGTEGKKSWWI